MTRIQPRYPGEASRDEIAEEIPALKTNCPHCQVEVEIPEKRRYQLIECPECKERFEALGKGTMISAQNFLDQIRKLQSFDSEED